MDLIFVEEVVRPRTESEIPPWQDGDAFVAGGTWLFSEPQPDARRLIDLSQVAWPAISVGDDTVEIAANCTYQTLERFDWSALPAARVFPLAIRSLSSSFKTYGLATVGGNICLAFAKGMMTPVFTALDARYELLLPGGDRRIVAASAFQTGVCRTIRSPGEYLRRIHVPRASFARRIALRRASFTPTSHVIAMVIATIDPVSGTSALTLSGALVYPVKLTLTSPAQFAAPIATACVQHPMLDDAHGSPEYRRALLIELAREALAEVAG